MIFLYDVEAYADGESQEQKGQVSRSQVDQFHGDQVDDVGDPEEVSADNERIHAFLLHLNESQRNERTKPCPQYNN